MATHSSVLAWRIPGTGEPGGVLSVGSHRVGHDWSDLAAAAADFSSDIEGRKDFCYFKRQGTKPERWSAEESIFNKFCNSITEFLNSWFFFSLDSKKSHFSISLSVPLSLSFSFPPFVSLSSQRGCSWQPCHKCAWYSQIMQPTGKLRVMLLSPSASEEI